MKTHVILTYNKIILLDLLLPLLMELKGEGVKITVLVYNSHTYEYLIQNYNIMEALKIAEAGIMVSRSWNRIVDIVRLAWLLTKCIGRTNIVLKAADTLPRHKQTISFMKKIGRVVECKALSQIVEPSAVKGHLAYGLIEPEFQHESNYDVLLSSEPEGNAPKTVYLGYLKRLPDWSKFVKEAHEKFLKDISYQSYYFFALSSTEGKRLEWLDEPDRYELLCETLNALKQFSDRLHAVLRPHPVSKIESINKAIQAIGFSNYTISYAHPSVISMGAKFFISNCFSITSIDAHRMGVPTIDYFRYDNRLEDLCGGWSPGGRLVNYYIKTPDLLASIINWILL